MSLLTLLIDLRLQVEKLSSGFLLQIDSCMDLSKLLAKRFTLLPWFAHVHRRLDSFGLKIPLLDPLLDFLDLILLVAADRSQFAPASAS